jgi:hypothetical protein
MATVMLVRMRSMVRASAPISSERLTSVMVALRWPR